MNERNNKHANKGKNTHTFHLSSLEHLEKNPYYSNHSSTWEKTLCKNQLQTPKIRELQAD